MVEPRKQDAPRPAAPAPRTEVSSRKAAIRDWADRAAAERKKWIRRNAYYYAEDRRYMRFLVPEGLAVLDLGCGPGGLLAELRPARGVGVDFSERMIELARELHPELEFHVGDIEDPGTLASIGGPFDVIVLSDTIGSLDDCQAALEALHPLCTRDTRVVVAYYSHFWEPILKLGEMVGLKTRQMPQNRLSSSDIAAILELADFQIVKREWRQLAPRRLLGLGPLINRFVGTLPVVRYLCLRNYVVARPAREMALGRVSASVVVPCRNEKGNIEAAVRRLPRLADDMEIIFVEGHSEDGTLEEMRRVQRAYPYLDIKVLVQQGRGKGDAVRTGFEAASGEILIILDGDLTVPPEDLPKFYRALADGKGEFVNGSRLVYPMERQAMPFLNHMANSLFSALFSWLLNQRFTDTLCGTKALGKRQYQRIAANRSYFGDFDPFGDFDLVFGASKLNLKVVEVPIRYRSREYGETQISRFGHGWLLVRMVVFAFFKLKAF